MFNSGLVWAQDRIFLHDQLQAGAVPEPIRAIAAAGNLERVGEMGMSFGGATAGTVCMIDRRCAAGINLDGLDFPFQAFGAEMPVPFLMFHSDLGKIARTLGAAPADPPHGFNAFSYEAFGAPARPDIYRVQMKGALHLGLSDFSLFLRRPLRDPLFGTTPTKVMIGAQNAFVLGFFEQHLKGASGGFPAPQMKTYADWMTPVGDDEIRRWWATKTDAERAAIGARIQRVRAALPPPAPRPAG
jgi:predicted dienelactone hydrolase